MRTSLNGATTISAGLQEDILAASKARFETLEIWSPKLRAYLKNHTIEDAKNLLDDSKVQAASLCAYGMNAFTRDPAEHLGEMCQIAAAAGELECPALVVYPDIPPAGMPTEQAFEQAARMTRYLAEVCADHGVKLALEPQGMHPFVPGLAEAMRIVEEADHPSVGIVMDTFHFYKSGVTLADIRGIPVETLLLIHLKDCEDLPEEQLEERHQLYPGMGCIPLEQMIGAVALNGYDGPISVEVTREEYGRKDPVAVAREAKRYLDTFLAKLGVARHSAAA